MATFDDLQVEDFEWSTSWVPHETKNIYNASVLPYPPQASSPPRKRRRRAKAPNNTDTDEPVYLQKLRGACNDQTVETVAWHMYGTAVRFDTRSKPPSLGKYFRAQKVSSVLQSLKKNYGFTLSRLERGVVVAWLTTFRSVREQHVWNEESQDLVDEPTSHLDTAMLEWSRSTTTDLGDLKKVLLTCDAPLVIDDAMCRCSIQLLMR